jgi:hypothetical protein
MGTLGTVPHRDNLLERVLMGVHLAVYLALFCANGSRLGGEPGGVRAGACVDIVLGSSADPLSRQARRAGDAFPQAGQRVPTLLGRGQSRGVLGKCARDGRLVCSCPVQRGLNLGTPSTQGRLIR